MCSDLVYLGGFCPPDPPNSNEMRGVWGGSNPPGNIGGGVWGAGPLSQQRNADLDKAMIETKNLIDKALQLKSATFGFVAVCLASGSHDGNEQTCCRSILLGRHCCRSWLLLFLLQLDLVR